MGNKVPLLPRYRRDASVTGRSHDRCGRTTKLGIGRRCMARAVVGIDGLDPAKCDERTIDGRGTDHRRRERVEAVRL